MFAKRELLEGEVNMELDTDKQHDDSPEDPKLAAADTTSSVTITTVTTTTAAAQPKDRPQEGTHQAAALNNQETARTDMEAAPLGSHHSY